MPHARIVDIRPTLPSSPAKAHAWQVLHEAARVEPDEAARIDWYRNDPIAGLDLQTAEALVATGRYEEVLTFLRNVKHDLALPPVESVPSF